MSQLSLAMAAVGVLVIVVGLPWRLRRSRKSRPEGTLTRPEVWAHTQALAEHFRSCGTATGRNCADQVMIALNEFVCKHESPANEV